MQDLGDGLYRFSDDCSTIRVDMHHSPRLLHRAGEGEPFRENTPYPICLMRLSSDAANVWHAGLIDPVRIVVDRDIEIRDISGRVLWSGVEAGPISQELREDLIGRAWRFGAHHIVDYPAGQAPALPCCTPLLKARPGATAGETWHEWMVHDIQVDGPDGWHRRIDFGSTGRTDDRQWSLSELGHHALPTCATPRHTIKAHPPGRRVFGDIRPTATDQRRLARWRRTRTTMRTISSASSSGAERGLL